MSHFSIPNRPFATDRITGLMLPDGIFVTMLGRQNLTVQIRNQGATNSAPVDVYIESVSHPSIVVFAKTHALAPLQSQATTTVAWTVDVSACPAGVHYVSVIVDESGTKHRIIKKFFVLGVTFNPSQGFVAEMPEGRMTVKFGDLVKPRRKCCAGSEQLEPELEPARDDHQREGCCGSATKDSRKQRPMQTLVEVLQNFRRHDPDFRFCPPGYLLKTAEYAWEPTPAFQGQYSDLPFEDPWWKVVLAVLALLLLAGAAIAEGLDGSGSVTASVEDPPTSSGPVEDCCGVEASGGGTSYIAAGLVAAAAAAATAAGLSDARDAFRVGEDKTPPGDGETTLSEQFGVEFSYPESVALGRPFVVEADWWFKRNTDVKSYEHQQKDAHSNIHVASSYEITAPEIAERYNPDKPWIIRGKFIDANGTAFRGADLFVQCFMISPSGRWYRYMMQDDGIWPDESANGGVYAAHVDFRRIKAETGSWHYFVIAQDVNTAQPDMKPEEAAQIIGGMVITHQLTLSFTEDECPIIPDGYVLVV
ncbi:MAG: hypothetical protein AAF996_13190 [Pseudomonadota bacterium]